MDKPKNMDRRSFLKHLGIGAAATVTALAGCKNNSNPVAGNITAQGEVPTDKMTYRLNPKSGEKVSLLGYGCMRWPVMPDPAGEGEIIDQDAVNSLVDYALAHGINYFDTAPPYCRGLSEKATGIALKRHPRDSYYIATKMSNHRLVGQGSSPQELYDESVKMYRNSFRDLQTDYIDYYLLHIVGIGEGLPTLMERFFDNNLLEFLLKEREAGRIRNLGFSYHGDIKAFDYLLSRHDEFHWDFVQIQLNYVDWDDKSNLRRGMPEAEYLYRELAARNIPVVIMEPLLGGRLAKVPKNVEAKMKQRRPDDSIASWAFRYAGTFPEVLTVLSGMTYMEHLQDNLATYSPLNPLNDDERTFLHLAALDILQNATVPCTDCRYCLPCPYGLDIPGIFRHYNKCINDDNAPRDVNDPRYAEARRAYLVGYDREVPRLRQANRCVQCRACEHKCPQQLPIVEHLANISHYTEQLRQGKA